MKQKTKHFIRIVLFTLSLYLVTHGIVLLLLPLALILSLLNRKGELQRLKIEFAKVIFKIVGQKIHISGFEHLHPQTRYLIVANYPSGYAMFALMLLSPNASFVAHEFISRIPFLGQFLTSWGTIFVNSKYPLRSYQAIDKALEKGISTDLIILPEGQRSPDGEIHPFKRGFVHILKHTNLDLLPVSLNGFYTLKPMNRMYLDPDTELTISVHEPISNQKIKELPDERVISWVESLIREKYRQ